MPHFSDSPLLTGFSELTKLQAYFLSGMNGRASFELFAGLLSEHRNFSVAVGLGLPLYLRTCAHEPTPSYPVRFSSHQRQMAAATDVWLEGRGREDGMRRLKKKAGETAK